MSLEHANLYVEGGATAQTELATGTLWSKITAFTTVGPENAANANLMDEIEILHDAIYWAFAQVDFIGTENTRFEFALLKNDKATHIRAGRSITATGTYGNVCLGSTLPPMKAGDRLALGVQAPATGTSITIENAYLTAFRINNEW